MENSCTEGLEGFLKQFGGGGRGGGALLLKPDWNLKRE